jgi:antitoxin VapB
MFRHMSWVRLFWRCPSAYASGGAFRGMAERRVKLFRNGRNQAVRIPREFELPGNDATIRREGRRLIIEPAPPKSLLAVLASLPTLREDFPPTEDRPAEPTPSLPSPRPLPNPPPQTGEGRVGEGGG